VTKNLETYQMVKRFKLRAVPKMEFLVCLLLSWHTILYFSPNFEFSNLCATASAFFVGLRPVDQTRQAHS